MATLLGEMQHYDRLTMIGVNFGSSESWGPWLSDRLAGAGYKKVRFDAYGKINVAVFERER
jgi:hypothetical protein